ncbi:adenosine deaminase [Williamsia sp.]|uniref:adenosine deaminase n=1 Tax=Williamsia sp. TaxID=1872085 RepID=UPI002F9384DE
MITTPAITTPTLSADMMRRLPKAEVHVHLEGCFDIADLVQSAHAVGADLPGPAATLFDTSTHHVERDPDGAAVKGMGVGTFLQFLDWEGSLVRTHEHLVSTAYRACARESASGVHYADIIVNPTHWASWKGRLTDFTRAIAEGFDEAARDGLCEANLCVSLLRQQSGDSALEVVREMIAARVPRVVALSIDGDETHAGDTNAKFAPAFTLARDAGFRRTVHTGESSGPESVWGAIDLLHAERIDHGVRSIEDPRLVDVLAERQIPLGMCPRSNVEGLKIYPSLDVHPIEPLRRAGVKVSINTDDPAPMSVRIEDDYADCARTFGWDLATVKTLAATSIHASFASDEIKTRMLTDLHAFEG